VNWSKVKDAIGTIEKKVVAMTGVTTLAGAAAAVLNNVNAHSELLRPLPAWLQMFVLAFLPGGVAAVAGYAAPHTPRPDLAAAPAPAPTPEASPTPPGPGA